jgi:hypothetical protein
VFIISPMLATRLTDLSRLTDPRYIAEPKLEGQRAQVHVRDRRTVACYSRPGRDLLRQSGFAWLRRLTRPVDAAVFDGEACAGDGHDIQAVFTERHRIGGDMSACLFDLQELRGRSVVREPWRDRQKRLQDALPGISRARVTAAVVAGAALLSLSGCTGFSAAATCNGAGGQYIGGTCHAQPGGDAIAREELEVIVTGGSGDPIRWGDWGLAVVLEFTYQHPRTAEQVHIRQAVRISRSQPFELRLRERARSSAGA